MSRWIFGSFFLISASFALGQLDSNSVTVTASRNSNLQPDLILFTVTVYADSRAALNDILAAVQPAGVTIADLTGVSTANTNPSQVGLQWSFALTTPLGSLKDTSSMLTRLQGTIGQSNKSLSMALAFSLQGSAFSKQLQQSQPCVITDLLNDARTKAQGMANAAGRTLSSVLAVSGMTAPVNGPAYTTSAVSQNCSVTVKFGLLGN
jgi:hypothetical protein